MEKKLLILNHYGHIEISLKSIWTKRKLPEML